MQNIELLAPAGSYEALVAAVQNGANAIYLGGNEFSARAFATNFNREELQAAVAYGHLRNVKIYVTVNTLYEDNQFEKLQDYLLFLQTIKVDALIIQDIGLMSFVKQYFPDFEIHMSTQTSIYNLSAVKYFEDAGVERVVLARENTLDEIADICQNTILDIEVFVHGALCMSYSGQCLMSSMIAKRSGNKGACGQPCRLAYKLQKDSMNLDKIPSYLLSPKDLCTFENIGQLIDAGVTSFKIEGRMKRPEYVATIVKQYREAIDAYLKNTTVNAFEQRIKKMKQMFNRGFTGGYILKDQNFVAKDYPGNRGIEVGTVIDYDKHRKIVKIQLQDKLKQGDRINFKSVGFTRTITKLYLFNNLINQGNAGDIVEIELNTPVKKNETVYKVIDIDLINEALASYKNENIKNTVTMAFSGQINEPARLTINYKDLKVEKVSNLLIESAAKLPLDPQRIRQQLGKLGNTVFKANDITIDFPDNGFFSIKEINEMRRQAIDELSNMIVKIKKVKKPMIKTKHNHINKQIKGIVVKIYNLAQLKALLTEEVDAYYFPINEELDEAISLAHSVNKEIIPFTSFLNNQDILIKFKNSVSYNKINSILVGDYGALQIFKDKKCILDSTFNLYNSYALNYFNNHDAILSLEMSRKQVNHLNNIKQNIIMTVYGKTINTHLKHCLISDHYFNCKKIKCNLCKQGKFTLIDRKGEQFDIFPDQDCNNLIFNSHCLYIDHLEKLEVDFILLSFSNEAPEITKAVFRDFKNNIMFAKPRQISLKTKLTNGYFYD